MNDPTAAARPALGLHDPVAIRHAGPDLLSLALMNSRNRLLHLLAQDESPAALRRAVRAGWYQEYWLSRHLQRRRGEACDVDGPRLAGIEPAVDEWLGPGSLPPPDALRAYLAQTLEITLDLLASSPDSDAALYFFRMSLLHEDRLGSMLAERLLPSGPPPRPQQQEILFGAQRWRLGSERQDGLVPYLERWAHEVDVPEFEIDAQPLNWARFIEFSEDGGYDRAELWSPEGWAWVLAEGRRAPRHVEQLQGGVVLQRGHGQQQSMVRASAAQPVTHLSRHEAQAWCAWAGRRLPTEPEWELAVSQGRSRGLVWGDVFEWVAGGARCWPGAGVLPAGTSETLPLRPQAGVAAASAQPGPAIALAVLRGASFCTPPRWRHPKSRRFVSPTQDRIYAGFRSCAI